MLKMLSKKVAKWCCRSSSQDNYDIAVYGIEILLDTITKFFALTVIALLSGSLTEMLISVSIFSSLRFFAGGKHMMSSLGCFLSMFFIYLFTVLVTWLTNLHSVFLPDFVLLPLLLLLIVLTVLYAPAPSINNPITDKIILHKKKIGAVILTCIFCIAIYFLDRSYKTLILIPLICEVVTILPIVNYKIKREEVYNYESK